MAVNPNQQFLAENRKRLQEQRQVKPSEPTLEERIKGQTKMTQGVPKGPNVMVNPVVTQTQKSTPVAPVPGVFVNKTTGKYYDKFGTEVDTAGRPIPQPVEGPSTATHFDQYGNPLPDEVQTQREQLAGLGEELFPGEKTVYSSLEEELKAMTEAQKREKEQMAADISLQNRLEQEQLAESKMQGERSIAGVEATFAQGREGVISATAPMIASDFRKITTQKIDSAIAQVDNARQRRDALMKQLEEAQREGRAARVIEISNEISAAQAAEAQAQADLLDAQVAASEESRAMQGEVRANLEAFQSIVGTGAELGMDSLMQFSQMLNLPLESVYEYYSGSQLIRDDKTLTLEEKKIALMDKAQQLDRQLRGITNAELEKVDYIENLYRSGASQEEITRTKRILGIKDEDDPVYQLDLQIKQAEARIKEAEANGELISPLDQLDLAKKYAELADKTGGTGVYVPSNSKYQAQAIGNSLVINVTDGQKLARGQCGEFVNDVLGIGVGDTLADKARFIDKSIVIPSAGMAFVTSRGYDLGGGVNSGHIGIVESVNADGTFNTVESNYNGDEKITRRQNVPITEVVGFIRPKKADLIGGVGGEGSIISTLDEKVIDNVRAEAGDFRQEPIVKDYNTIVNKAISVTGIIDSGVGGPADLALVFEFMKALDPTSVVRETEYDNAAKSGNIFAGSFAKFNGYFKEEGGFLPDSVKKAFKELIDVKLKSSQQQYDNLYKQYTNRINSLAGGKNVAPELLTDYSSVLDLTGKPANEKGFSFTSIGLSYADPVAIHNQIKKEVEKEVEMGLDTQAIDEINALWGD